MFSHSKPAAHLYRTIHKCEQVEFIKPNLHVAEKKPVLILRHAVEFQIQICNAKGETSGTTGTSEPSIH